MIWDALYVPQTIFVISYFPIFRREHQLFKPNRSESDLMEGPMKFSR